MIKNIYYENMMSTQSKASTAPLNYSPTSTYLQKHDYSTQPLQKFCIYASSGHTNKIVPQNLVCICPNTINSPNNQTSVYALQKKNEALQKKIASMKKMLNHEENKISKIREYQQKHEICGSDCYKRKYLQLLRNTMPH